MDFNIIKSYYNIYYFYKFFLNVSNSVIFYLCFFKKCRTVNLQEAMLAMERVKSFKQIYSSLRMSTINLGPRYLIAIEWLGLDVNLE